MSSKYIQWGFASLYTQSLQLYDLAFYQRATYLSFSATWENRLLKRRVSITHVLLRCPWSRHKTALCSSGAALGQQWKTGHTQTCCFLDYIHVQNKKQGTAGKDLKGHMTHGQVEEKCEQEMYLLMIKRTSNDPKHRSVAHWHWFSFNKYFRMNR